MSGETIIIPMRYNKYFLNHKIELDNVIKIRNSNSLNNPASLP